MDQQVLEWLTLDRHTEFAQPHTIGLQSLTRTVNLLQDGNLLLIQGPPRGNVALKGAQLAGLVATGMLLAKPFKQSLGFQTMRIF